MLEIIWSDFWSRYLKFIVVGAGGFGIDLITTWAFKDKYKLQKYLANTIGFIIGILFRYILNRIWTFESSNPHIIFEFISFMTIALIGLGIVTGIIYLLHDKWGKNFYFAKVIAMIIFMFWNYSANYFFTFQ